MTPTDIKNAVTYLLVDPNEKFWTEFLDHMKEGIEEIVKIKPDAVTETSNITLAAGPRQTLPSGSKFLIDMTRNRGADGNEHGPAITAVDMRRMDRMVPGWQRQTGRYVEHFMYDLRDKQTVWVYPSKGSLGNRVEVICAAEPTLPTAINATPLQLGDEYMGPLISYVLFRAHQRDSKEASPARAAQHYQTFLQQMGVYPPTEAATAAGEREQGGLR